MRHTMGPGEDGIGPLGLDKRWHRDKWPGDPEPAWCLPEASALVALDIARRAVVRHGAKTLTMVQAVYAFRTYRDEYGDRHIKIDPNADARLCRALRARGRSCREHIDLADIGRPTPVADRRRRAFELAGRWWNAHN